MGAHKSFRTSERLAPFAIISRVRFSAASGVRSLFGFRPRRPHDAGGIAGLYFAVPFESRFRGTHHVLRLGSRFMTRSS